MRQSSKNVSVAQRDIRAIAGDHYVNIPVKVAKSAVSAKLVDGILPAGTAVAINGAPANGTTSYGLVFADFDFNNSKGTETISVMIHGFVDTARLQSYSGEVLTAEAKTAMNMIKFL